MNTPISTFDAGERYRVRDVLGSGAFGIVYRVFDERWGQELALKTIKDASPELRQWFKAEYRSLRDIAHPNLVRLHELHVDDGLCFFTMDVVQDGELFTRRLDFDREGPEADQRAAIRRICRAGLQLADALRTVHAFDKCHRDIKPTNILMTAADQVVLLDFGMASPVDRHRWLDTARDTVMGTLPYLAPEQYFDPRPLPASDWYSAGLVLYETLVGDLPFQGDPQQEAAAKQSLPRPPTELVGTIPGPLERLILGLLEPDPRRRPSADEVIAVLREQGDEPDTRVYWSSRRAEIEQDFIGRDGEIATLRASFAAAGEGHFVAVEVVGPSGMGKTALVRHFLAELQRPGSDAPLVFEARCHPHESIPYKAFDAVVDDLTRYWVGLDAKAAAALCPDEGMEALTLLFPELRRVPLLDAKASSLVRRGDPRALRQLGFQALRAVLAKLRALHPVVLWVDDVQWADADSVALVESVFGVEGAPPVLLLLSRRPDDETAQPALHAAISLAQRQGKPFQINLGPLAVDSALCLARSITERAGGAALGAASAIVEAAAGLPYLVSELAHFATERREIEGDRSPGPTAASLMHERLQSLSSADRTLIELAALCGTAQSPAVLLDAAGSRDRSRFRDLCVLRLLRWSGVGDDETLQIYHDRLRESVVGALDPQLSVRHHLSLVSAMEASGFGDAQQLMGHALAAGDRVRTERHALTAAKRAETALAFDQAARLYGIALKHTADGAPRAELHELLAESQANAGHSTSAAPEFERAVAALAREVPDAVQRRGFLRRRAGEQYLKAGHFEDGLRLMEAFLAEASVKLPRTGNGALAVSASRRIRLYLGGFDFTRRPAGQIAPSVRARLDDLWAATTALSMMDPVRSDGVGLIHFLEALRAGDADHVARSLGYEAAFAALIGGPFLRNKARDLLRRNRAALEVDGKPYERAFYNLGAGTSAFFHSDWSEAATLCDSAARGFRAECRGAEYEAAVAVVFSLQALGQAGKVSELVARIPAAIREADARGDLFAANNYRGGFHALGRIAAGQIDEVRADVQKVVETWKPGFYQMHAYHRVFAGVAADLYIGNPRSAMKRIEGDWPELEAGLFLRMELPAMELRWTRARAALAVANQERGKERKARLAQVKTLTRAIQRATVSAARPHAALLTAGLAATESRSDEVIPQLRIALDGYAAAGMAIHREVARWSLGRLLAGGEGRAMLTRTEDWMRLEGVPEMAPLARALAPGLEPGA
ncbi:MAG: serine/threonine-protein kinase [Byssovorax sp.]